MRRGAPKRLHGASAELHSHRHNARTLLAALTPREGPPHSRLRSVHAQAHPSGHLHKLGARAHRLAPVPLRRVTRPRSAREHPRRPGRRTGRVSCAAPPGV
eukprot:scaffold84157_cov51-Phaeocystis_antarctica.AAC.2